MTARILLFDAPAGAGKTRSLTRQANLLAKSGEKVLFIQPTRKLIDKTVEEELLPLQPLYPYTAIHGGHGGSVVNTMIAHFTDAEAGIGEIVFATHAAFFLLPYFPQKRRWHLIVDEVPTVDVYEEHRLADTHGLLLPLVSVAPHDDTYGLLVPAEAA